VGALRQKRAWLLLACGAALAAARRQWLLGLRKELRPQIPSDSILTLVLGDARMQLSQILFDKVEEYFHGGVRCVACEHGLGQTSGHRDHEERHEGGHAEGGREACASEAAAAGGRAAAFDPWSWLNERVHVQVHRHMENESAVELLPWVWASCRASPQNIEAVIAGSYVLSRMAGRPEEALQLLEEGIRANPECAELDFTCGELLLNRMGSPARAEPFFRAALRKNAPAEGEAGAAARAQRMKILFYLGYLAKQRGDLSQLRAAVREADALDARHVCAHDLHKLLEAAERKD
jgi:hypothetical protein